MRTFCTLFDKNYLYQGMALYRSLVLHADEFTLYVLCMDSRSYVLLGNMRLPGLVPIKVEDLLTPEIAGARARTTHGQFCWVCQPLICSYILERFDCEMVTYLESDSIFFSSPEPLFDEMGSRSVTLVPHNYSRGHDYRETSGIFCVQFNAFRNDAHARGVLAYWTECCFRYNKSAPRAYPGQTTMDEWPSRFPCVAVLNHRGAGVAPWNVLDYQIEIRDGAPHVNGVPVVFYHYHQYGRVRGGAHDLGTYPLTRPIIDAFYRFYISEIRQAEFDVQAIDPSFSHRREYTDSRTVTQLLESPSRENVRAYLRVLKRRIRGTYNVFADTDFSDLSCQTGRP